MKTITKKSNGRFVIKRFQEFATLPKTKRKWTDGQTVRQVEGQTGRQAKFLDPHQYSGICYITINFEFVLARE